MGYDIQNSGPDPEVEDNTDKFEYIEKLNNNLFAHFGFGIQGWFLTLMTLFGVFSVISSVAVLLMYIYASKDKNGLEMNENKGFFDNFNKYTLGNIGFAQSQCYFQSPLIPNKQEIECKKGTLSDLKHRGAYLLGKNQKLKPSKELS